MPNIVEYNATGEITPSDKGIQAAEQAGRVYAEKGREIGSDIRRLGDQVEHHMSVMETSELYKTGTELKMHLQTLYEKQSALPENRNNPHFGDQFMAEVGPQLDQWGKGAQTDRGRELATTMKANIRNELFNHVAAGQSEMDAAHVQDNATQTMNTLGAGLITDPSEGNLDRTLGTAKDAIQGMTMSIPDVATRERVATELNAQYMPQLVVSRYQGVAESIKNQVGETGEETSPALEQLNKDIANQVGFQYLKPETQARIADIRDQAVSQGKELFRTKDTAQRRQESDDFDAALLPIETELFKPNGSGGVTMAPTPDILAAVQKAAQMPGARQHPEKIESLLNALHTATQDQITGKETVTDRPTYMSLSGKIGSTTDPLTKADVDTARAQNKLSDTDYHFLRESASDTKAANPKINHAMEELHRWQGQVKPVIDKSDPLAGSIDQQGAEKFSYFSWDTENKVRQAIASGEDPEAAVHRLTDPRNPNGFYHYIPNYQTSNKQGLANVLQMTRPGGVQPQAPVPGGINHAAPPPPLKGESPADYLKRTNQ